MEIEYMPIHPDDIKLPNCPQRVPMALLEETVAYRNHGQTLKRLKERGGLGVKEVLSIIEDKPWSYFGRTPIASCIEALNKILEQQTK